MNFFSRTTDCPFKENIYVSNVIFVQNFNISAVHSPTKRPYFYTRLMKYIYIMIFKDSPHQWFLLHVGGLTPTQSPNLLTLFHIIAGMYSNSPCERRWLCVFAYDWVGTGGPKLCSRTHNKLDTQKYRDSAILLPESEI